MKNHKLAIFVLIFFLGSIACNTIGEIRTLLTQEADGLYTNGAPTSSPDEGTPAPLDTGGPPPLETLELLKNTIVLENDPVELADRLLGIENVPATVPPHGPYEVGERRTFWVLDNYERITYETETELLYKSDLLYFWVEVGVSVRQSELEDLAHAFEDQMVPTNRAFFGEEWIPGIDNDPHIYIVYTRNIGSNAAGVFVSTDEVPPLAEPNSNAAELFMVNASNTPLSDEYAYGVLAHEFQHMIHWYRDRNETSWINEGMSELATVLNGYSHGGFASQYLYNPDLQLNDWPNDQDATSPYYGSGMLFVTYFLDRFGNQATQALVGDPENGLESVDSVLAQLALSDPLTNASITAEDVVLDWGIANYLSDESVGDGRYAYRNYPEILPTTASATEIVTDCTGANTRNVHQYGFDYIDIACSGPVTLRFEGSRRTGLLPASSYSGDYAFWSNKGDESDMTLTRPFDFTGVSGPITFSYYTWYDIETDWDYVYLLASTNNGDDWKFITTPGGTDTDPTGNSYGWGYTGVSGGGFDVSEAEWIQESVDLSEYAGQKILLRFEYITDAAVNGEGLLVDDISIEETGYFEDFEANDGGWQAQGFARVQNVLPQHFRLALISRGNGTTVQIIEVPEGNLLDIPLELGGDVNEVTLVVMGATRFTRQPATYRFSFVP